MPSGLVWGDSRGQPFTRRFGWLQRRHSANPDVIGVVPACNLSVSTRLCTQRQNLRKIDGKMGSKIQKMYKISRGFKGVEERRQCHDLAPPWRNVHVRRSATAVINPLRESHASGNGLRKSRRAREVQPSRVRLGPIADCFALRLAKSSHLSRV